MPTDIISITEFKNDATGWLERLQHQPPLVLTQNGRGRAVVQSYESWQQQRFAMALLERVMRRQLDAEVAFLSAKPATAARKAAPGAGAPAAGVPAKAVPKRRRRG